MNTAHRKLQAGSLRAGNRLCLGLSGVFPSLTASLRRAHARERRRNGEYRITRAARPSPTAALRGRERAPVPRRGLRPAALPKGDPACTPPAARRRGRAPRSARSPPAGPQRRRARHPTAAASREVGGGSARRRQIASPRSSKYCLREFPTVATSPPSPCVTGFSPPAKTRGAFERLCEVYHFEFC